MALCSSGVLAPKRGKVLHTKQRLTDLRLVTFSASSCQRDAAIYSLVDSLGGSTCHSTVIG